MISTLLPYPSAVATEIRYEEQRFPTVTICNQNPCKRQAVMVAGNPDFAAMNTMLQTYQQAARQALSSADIYGFQVTNRVHSKKGY